MKNIELVVAVVGCQRSGTTLTAQILGAHPSAVLIDEPDGLYAWFHAYVEGRPDADALWESMPERIAAKYRNQESRFVRAGRRLVLDDRISVLVLKAPNLTYDDQKLARMGLPVVSVYLVRDPRAVVASMAKLEGVDFVGNQLGLTATRPWVEASNPIALQTLRDVKAPLWIRQAAAWRIKSGRQPEFGRAGIPVHQVRYEDLVCEPERRIADMLRACRLSSSVASLHPHSTYLGRGPGDTDRTRPIDRTSIANWRSQLGDGHQNDILRAAGPLAARLGYR